MELKKDDLIRIGGAVLFFPTEDFRGRPSAMQFYRERGHRIIETLAVKIPPR
ncbi:MAG TPA: hypothetical protein VHX86_18955 [Tepidisphaeraceae bacterium]|nr:hypothetical protein [Tepidisphaeraceae bacterium]